MRRRILAARVLLIVCALAALLALTAPDACEYEPLPVIQTAIPGDIPEPVYTRH